MAGKRLPAAERRHVIITAARSVFLDVGFEGSRTITIAKRAGINEAMLYQHFPSKRALFESAVLEPVRQRLGRLVDDAEAAVQAEMSLQEMTGQLEKLWLQAMSEIGPLLGTALVGDSESGQATYRTIVLPLLRRLDAVVARTIRYPDERSSWTITRALFGANLLLGLQLSVDGAPTTEIEEVAHRFGGLMSSGLSAP